MIRPGLGEQMDQPIDIEILKSASKCSRRRACQQPDGLPLGEPKALISDRLLELDAQSPCDSYAYPYNVTFGAGFFCTCPARIEIFMKYFH
jgi:hypothetical protein